MKGKKTGFQMFFISIDIGILNSPHPFVRRGTEVLENLAIPQSVVVIVKICQAKHRKAVA
jgi:hypothetical protein